MAEVKATGPRGHPQLLHRRLAVDDDLGAILELQLHHVTGTVDFDIRIGRIRGGFDRCLEAVQLGRGQRQELGFTQGGHAKLQGRRTHAPGAVDFRV